MRKNWVLYLEKKRKEAEEERRSKVFYNACVDAADYIVRMYGYQSGYPAIDGLNVHFTFAVPGKLTRVTLYGPKLIIRPGVMLIKPYLEEALKKCDPEMMKSFRKT